MFEMTASKTPVKTDFPTFQPFRTPFSLFENLFNEVEGFWPKPLFRPTRTGRYARNDMWVPALDVYEYKGELVVKADLPGMKKEDVRMYFEDGALVLQGERKEEKTFEKDNYYVAECTFGNFYRRLPLTFKADPTKIAAHFTDGVLEVHIPMPVEERPKTQEIPLN